MYRPIPRSEEQDALKFEQARPLYHSEIRIYGQEVVRTMRVSVAALVGHEMNVGIGEGLGCGEVDWDSRLRLGRGSAGE